MAELGRRTVAGVLPWSSSLSGASSSSLGNAARAGSGLRKRPAPLRCRAGACALQGLPRPLHPRLRRARRCVCPRARSCSWVGGVGFVDLGCAAGARQVLVLVVVGVLLLHFIKAARLRGLTDLSKEHSPGAAQLLRQVGHDRGLWPGLSRGLRCCGL